jgi:predicted hydrolase (HD superfamily)
MENEVEYKNPEEVRQILSWYADRDMVVAEFWMNIDNLISKIKESVPAETLVRQKTPGINMEEILIKSMNEMEEKLYMILLKNNLKFEYTDKEFEQTNFDEYVLEETYDPERNTNIIEMVKK